MEELSVTRKMIVGQKSKSEDVLSKPTKDFLHARQKQGKKKRYLTNLKSNIGPLISLIILCMLFPSWDVYSDWAVTLKLLLSGNTWSGLAMMLPQMMNISFTFILWSKLETGQSRRFTWVLVIAQCWPQYCAAKIVCMIINGRSIV